MYTVSIMDAPGSYRLSADARLSESDFDAIASELAGKGLKVLRARKTGFVAAFQVTSSHPVESRAPGLTSALDRANEGDWVATNMSNERQVIRNKQGESDTYVIHNAQFADKYDRDEGSNEFGDVFRANSVVNALELPGGADVVASWGERQRFAHGYLIRNGPDVYCIDAQTFRSTYADLRDPLSSA